MMVMVAMMMVCGTPSSDHLLERLERDEILFHDDGDDDDYDGDYDGYGDDYGNGDGDGGDDDGEWYTKL